MTRHIAGEVGLSGQSGARAKMLAAAVLLAAAAIAVPNSADAAHGGGGFHGGGFHGAVRAGGFGEVHGGAFGGFHAGGFSGGVVRSAASPSARIVEVHPEFRGGSGGGATVLRGGGEGGHWHQGWHNGRYGWWFGDGPYLWGNDGLYGDSGTDAQPYAPQEMVSRLNGA
jgi:hypothetical protein